MNVPEVELGAALTSFKEETKNLKPPYRGKVLGNNAFIRNIHNSFVRYGRNIKSLKSSNSNHVYNRRMDILDADLGLYEDVEKWEKSKKSKRKRTTKKKKKKKVDSDDVAFHFIAYVPIEGTVWKLDGLRRQPESLGIFFHPIYF